MINVSDITQALKSILNSNVNVSDFVKKEVTVGEFVNADPNQAPWIGIYRGDGIYNPERIGRGSNEWELTQNIRILVQAVDLKSGEDCEVKLENYVKILLDAIWLDSTINNTVDMINSFSVEYTYSEIDRKSLSFQTAIITIEVEVKTS